MNKMIAIAFVLGLGGVAACGGGGDVGSMNKFKDRMCACTDQKCYDDVKKDEKEFEKTLEGKYKDEKDAPKELVDAVGAYEKCKDTAREKIQAGSASGGGSASGSGSASASGSATP